MVLGKSSIGSLKKKKKKKKKDSKFISLAQKLKYSYKISNKTFFFFGGGAENWLGTERVNVLWNNDINPLLG